MLDYTHFKQVVLIDYNDRVVFTSIRGNHWLTFGYKLTKNLKLSAGSNNLLNIYPTKQDEQGNTSGGYWDAVQMGFSRLITTLDLVVLN
jgi:iron complex outermembrane receptor protein